MNDYIVVSKRGTRQNYYTISAGHHFFSSDYIILNIYQDYVEIKLPSIDYNGKQYKPYNKSGKWHTVTIIDDKLKEGKFYLDEEDSTEDKLYFYFE